jgi:hypothetical protein
VAPSAFQVVGGWHAGARRGHAGRRWPVGLEACRWTAGLDGALAL